MPSPTRTSYTNAEDHATAESSVGSKVERLLIVRLGAMGDVIHTSAGRSGVASGIPRSDAGLADRRTLGGIVVHVVYASLGSSICAASVGRSGSHRQHSPVARRTVFGRHLGASGGQSRAICERHDTKLRLTFRARCVRPCWRDGRERRSSTGRPSLAKISPPCSTPASSSARATYCGTEFVAG